MVINCIAQQAPSSKMQEKYYSVKFSPWDLAEGAMIDFHCYWDNAPTKDMFEDLLFRNIFMKFLTVSISILKIMSQKRRPTRFRWRSTTNIFTGRIGT